MGSHRVIGYVAVSKKHSGLLGGYGYEESCKVYATRKNALNAHRSYVADENAYLGWRKRNDAEVLELWDIIEAKIFI